MFRLWDLDEDTGFRGSEVTEAQFWRKDEAISPAELEYGIKKARLNNCVLRKQVLWRITVCDGNLCWPDHSSLEGSSATGVCIAV